MKVYNHRLCNLHAVLQKRIFCHALEYCSIICALIIKQFLLFHFVIFIVANAIEAVKQDCAALEELVKSHDVVYLLMDTRESRWLPTLMCATMSKVIVLLEYFIM